MAKVRPIDPDGASEWMILGAVVIRARLEPDVVAWVRHIRATIKDTQGPDLHFRTLSDHRRNRVAEMVAELPLRGFALASHKVNMRGHHNLAAEAMNISPSPRSWFYNWCVRLLLERITRKCAEASKSEFGEVRPIKLVFSQRGGVKYNWLRVYLEVLKKQAMEGTTVLTKREIIPETINPDWIEVLPSRSSAGCQLADVVASAFLTAADASSTRWSIEPAKKLRPRMAHDGGIFNDCGLSLQPTPPWRAAKRMSSNQRSIFSAYGIDFE